MLCKQVFMNLQQCIMYIRHRACIWLFSFHFSLQFDIKIYNKILSEPNIINLVNKV